MAEPSIAERAEQWESIGEQMFTGFLTAYARSDATKAISSVIGDTIGAVLGAAVVAMSPVGVGLAKGIAASEDLVAPALSSMAAAAVNDMFGVDVPSSAFEGGIRNGRRQPASDALAAGLLRQLGGQGAALTPSDQPATRFLGVTVNMALEGWYQKWFFEFMTSLIPQLDIGKIENFGSLDDKMANALGLGRLTRSVLAPIVDTTIVEPLRWSVNKQYRPQLLTLSQAIRARSGGFITEDEFSETAGRLGYTDRLALAIAAEAQKRQSVDDYELLIRVGRANRDQMIQALREQGYDLAGAENEADLPRIKRIVAFERAMATEAASAFVAGRITRFELDDFISGSTIDEEERNQLRELAEARRTLRRKSLSPSEARACAKAGILTVRDYRLALEQDGYDADAVIALELLLRKELDDRATAEDLRQQVAAERAREKAERDERARLRREELARVRALRRRGTENDLERAVVRGLVPLARYVEILRDDFDLDTVDIMAELVEAERQDYLDQQAAAETAAQNARRRGVSLGDLRAAVFAGTLALPEFRAALDRLGLAAPDADLLTATLGAQLADRAAAQAAHDQAEAAARVKSISLARFERLVRRGVRSLADYDALLRGLGFEDASRAALRELMQLQIADDAERQRHAAAAAAAARAKGLSLDQWRRAVVLGIRTRDAYQAALVRAGFTADAIGALLALLDVDVAEAEDARRRRTEAEAPRDARQLPLSTVANAARLGVITPATYQARLVAAGYTADDIAIELALLVTEIADVQAARVRRDQLAQAQADRGLSLAQLARAVRLGVSPLDAYRARAIALGFDAEDVELLTAVVEQEAAEARTARARREALLQDAASDPAALGAVFDQVRSGALSIGAAGRSLAAAGVSPEDVELLTALFVDEQAGAGA